MLRFYAVRFIRVVEKVSLLRGALDEATDADRNTQVTTEIKDLTLELLKTIRVDCEAMVLDSTTDQIDRIITALGLPLTFSGLGALENDLKNRLSDDLGRQLLFHVNSYAGKFYDNPGFASAATAAFPAATLDIEESGKCFALGRWTACVFHLMRVMEHGLRALALFLGVPTDYKTWDPIIKKMRSEIENYSASSFKGDLDFIRQSLDRLTAVQTALRNEVMHARSFYDQERADDIYRAVRAFMEQLATKLGGQP